MRIAGNVENVGSNQCVLLHLAAGIFWNESGLSKRAPSRGWIFTLVREIRRLELNNALLATDTSHGDTSSEAMIAKSDAHDVRHPSHGRHFRTLGFFISSTLLDLKGGFLRKFDI